MNTKIKRNTTKRTYTIFVLISLIFVFIGVFLPGRAQAASLYISPGSGSFSVGSTFNVTVRVDTQGQAVNTAEANLTFSTDTLELVKVTSSPTFYLQAPGSPSRASGSAYFGGGLPSPGYNGLNGVVGTMTFRARQEGTATISITTGKVLLNDGSGTNALATTAGARYTIVPAPVATAEVTSTTHADSNKWYNKKDPELSWSRPSGAHGFSFELDQKEDTIPDNILDTTITTSKKYENLTDGIWYFHIKARRQPSGAVYGNTLHFKIQVDTTPPEPFEIRLVRQADLNDVTRTPTIEFEAMDATSGIDHYDIYIDDQFVETIPASPFTFSKLEGGPRIIKVAAFDKAGNQSSASLPIIVTGPAPADGFLSQTLQLPLYTLLVIIFLFLLQTIFTFWAGWRRPRLSVSENFKELQSELDSSFEKLNRQINSKLLRLFEKSSEELFAKEEKAVRQISKGIITARRQIDSRLAKLGNKRVTKKIQVSKRPPAPLGSSKFID